MSTCILRMFRIFSALNAWWLQFKWKLDHATGIHATVHATGATDTSQESQETT